MEDYPPIRDAVAASLRESGYAVDVTSDGQQGFCAASTANDDCIVLDRILPRLSGLEVLQQLRNARHTSPVLMLTAKDTTQYKAIGKARRGSRR